MSIHVKCMACGAITAVPEGEGTGRALCAQCGRPLTLDNVLPPAETTQAGGSGLVIREISEAEALAWTAEHSTAPMRYVVARAEDPDMLIWPGGTLYLLPEWCDDLEVLRERVEDHYVARRGYTLEAVDA